MAPIYMFILGNRVYNAKKRRDNRALVRFYMPLYEGKKIRHWLPLQYNTVFFLRRQILAFTLVLLSKHPIVQIWVMIHTSLLMLVYLLISKPYT